MNRIICVAYIVYAAVWAVLGFTVFTPVLSCIKGVALYAYPGYLCMKSMESENRLNIGMGISIIAIALTMISFLFYRPLYSGSVLPVLFLVCCIRQKRALHERNEVVGMYVEEEENE